MSERSCEAVGIDLGTTYSSLAYMDAQRMPRVVCDSNGQAVMPSVVFFDEDEIVVGDVALSQSKVHADQVVQFIKVHMGDEWRKTFQGKVHTPESISALILGQLIREAEPQIGPIRKAVITVPAYFTEKRRRATQQAGEIAGLEVIGTLNEPMSAALAYGLHNTSREQFAVVYDLGGGTFDVTIVRITPNEIEELATNGNRQLGGRDWDQTIVDYVCDQFQKEHHIDPRRSVQAVQDLIIECEKAKRRLSRMGKTQIRIHAYGRDHTSDISREQFETLTDGLLQATKLTTEIALEDAKLDWSKVSRIVLVGGSTNMPAVRTMLKEASGIQPDVAVNPVVAVALGAATYAHMLETGQAFKQVLRKEDPKPAPKPAALPPPLPPTVDPASAVIPLDDDEPITAEPVVSAGPRVRFVTAHGVGVKVRNAGVWKNSVLIPRNSSVPMKVTRRFIAKGDPNAGRFISIEITQGDAPDLALVELLGTGRIDLPMNVELGKPVDVTLEFDNQGRLHAHAIYAETGQEMKMSVDVRGGLKQEQLETYRQMMVETGFIRPFNAAEAISAVELDDDDDVGGLPMIEPA